MNFVTYPKQVEPLVHNYQLSLYFNLLKLLLANRQWRYESVRKHSPCMLLGRTLHRRTGGLCWRDSLPRHWHRSSGRWSAVSRTGRSKPLERTSGTGKIAHYENRLKITFKVHWVKCVGFSSFARMKRAKQCIRHVPYERRTQYLLRYCSDRTLLLSVPFISHLSYQVKP